MQHALGSNVSKKDSSRSSSCARSFEHIINFQAPATQAIEVSGNSLTNQRLNSYSKGLSFEAAKKLF